MFRLFIIQVMLLVLVVPARGQITAADADFDESGVVDLADFLLFVSVFGQTVETTPPVTTPVGGSVEGDRAALVALYNATGGDNWLNKTNWLSDKPLNEWYGIRTDTQGRVDSLNLSNNWLSGSIPSRLGNLSNLEYLDLWLNELSGPIPPELGNLPKLVYLNLRLNWLSGSIPSELGNLSNLEWLVLSNNGLSGSIPSELGNLSNLTALFLDSNQLSGQIPTELGNLTKLTRLGLSDNRLWGPIPNELGNLTNLEYLGLDKNNLCMPLSLNTWWGYYNANNVEKCVE